MVNEERAISITYIAGVSSLIGFTHGCTASSREKGEDGFKT